jgi:hypothetical protein
MADCPICGSKAGTLDKTGDYAGFDCPQHGEFKVVGTVFENELTKNATREQWESALQKAKARATPDTWPLIMTYDF